jgi:hypothetical protein
MSFALATNTYVAENRFRRRGAAAHLATPVRTRLRSSRFQEAEDAVIRREFFAGLSALAAVPLSLMPGPNFGCEKSGPFSHLVIQTQRGFPNRTAIALKRCFEAI